MVDLAIIGGTSLSEMSEIVIEEERSIETHYGMPSSNIIIGRLNNKKVAFLNRHGPEAAIPPHRVNYRANIAALKMLGAKNIIAVNAVGGITRGFAPMHISIPNQLIDYTVNREHTFHDGEEVEGRMLPLEFVDFTHPFDAELREHLIYSAREMRAMESGFSDASTYGCTQGPRLETTSEVRRMKNDGCDLVGMTLMPEAGLAREVKIPYASICLVVNWAAGRGQGDLITMEDIHKVVKQGGVKIQNILRDTTKRM